MALHKVLLLGATGETGGDILEGLVEDGGFVSINDFMSAFVMAHILNRILPALSNRHLPISQRSKLLKTVALI
jgi:uncharacterized protein (UPF0261 family)